MDKTLIIIKPDAFMQRVVGKIIKQLEDEDFDLLGAKLIKMTEEQAGKFYIEHKDKPFYKPLVKFMISNPCLVMAWGGEKVIEKSRKIIGQTDPESAKDSTIRGRWARDGRHNVIHGSDSKESAEREIEFFFPGGEGIYEWKEKKYIKK